MDQENCQQAYYYESYDADQMEEQQLLQVPLELAHLTSIYSQTPKLAYTYSGISNTSSNADYLLQSRLSEEHTERIKFFKHPQLYSSIKNTIDELKTQLLLDDDLILYLLYRYKWSCEKLNQSYYDQAESYQQKNQRIQIFKKEQENQIFGICGICFVQQKLFRNPLCIHRYCIGCWEKYIQNSLLEGRIFFSCMQKCEQSPILLYQFISIFTPQLVSLYRKKICINYCQFSKLITYCPNINCDLFCEKSQTVHQNNVDCLCGTIYCFQCRKQPHYPATCADVGRWQLLLNKEEDNVNWIKRNTKKCPSCKNAVEKSIGCSYIKCVCGTQFCYKCNQFWDEYHRDSKGECLKLIRKESLKEKGTSELFLILQEKIEIIERSHKRDMDHLKNIIANFSQEQVILEKVQELKREIQQAEQMRKWGLIVLFIYQKEQIHEFLDEQYIESIEKLMQPIEKISKMNQILQKKELLVMSDELMIRKQKMHKSQNLWMQAWRSL